MSRRSAAFLLFAFVVAAVLAFLVHSAVAQRDRDLRRISCDALRREVSSRKSAVQSGHLFAHYFPSPPVRAYYARTLPVRIANRDAAVAQFHHLGCPAKEAS